MQVDGSVAIVTGAGRGIGAAIARALVERNCRVVVLGHEEDEVLKTAADLGADPFVADVRDPAHAQAVVHHALAEHGRLDIVVANAGIGYAGNFVDMTPDRINDLVAVNVRGPMLLARAALPAMLDARRGSVVFISSIVGSLLVPDETVYSATKAAVDGFAEALREELRGTGVSVATVVPTAVRTGFFDERGEPYNRRFPRMIPAGRIADAVLDVITRDGGRRLVPRWIQLPIRIRGIAPATYRTLSRWLG